MPSWHAQIGDPTIADSILDQLVHNAHRIELQGESTIDEHGTVHYSFPRITREYSTALKIRQKITRDDHALGKIIFEN